MKNLLLLFLIFATFSVTAQENNAVTDIQLQTATGSIYERNLDGTESLENRPIRKSAHDIFFEQGAQRNQEGKEEWIGTTFYDLQTNGAGQNRIQADDAMNIRAVWTHHEQTEIMGFPNRGTGFNESVNSPTFGAQPTLRLEATDRTGWPNITTLDDGTDIIVNHLPAAVNDLVMLRRPAGATEWTQSLIPTEVNFGLLWPQIHAVGNTIHMVAVSTPAANGGAPWMGLDPALMYFRSQDGGMNWDISDFVFPGIDSTQFDRIGGDSYQLTADDQGNVAVAVFPSLADIILMKSTNGGDSWEKKIVQDFPFTKWTPSVTPYTLDEIGGIDPDGPGFGDEDSTSAAALSILTSDGSGAVALDSRGNAHVVFPQRYISAADTTAADGSFTFFPFFVDLIYWNECVDGFTRVNQSDFNLLDVNMDDSLAIESFNNFAQHNGNMAVSMPALSIDEDDRIVLAYTMAMENLVREDPVDMNPIQHYTHVWMTGSSDDGTSWVDPVDIINADLSLFPFLVEMTDAVFPNIQYAGGNNFALYYQFDDEPGLNLQPDAEADPINSNTIGMITIDVNDIIGLGPKSGLLSCAVGTENPVAPESFKFTVSPNPAIGLTTISFEMDRADDVQIELSNVIGERISQIEVSATSVGVHTHQIDLNQLTPGIYLVSLRTGDRIATQKLVVGK